MKMANRMIVAMLVVVVLAVGFWMLLLSPKREKARHAACGSRC